MKAPNGTQYSITKSTTGTCFTSATALIKSIHRDQPLSLAPYTDRENFILTVVCAEKDTIGATALSTLVQLLLKNHISVMKMQRLSAASATLTALDIYVCKLELLFPLHLTAVCRSRSLPTWTCLRSGQLSIRRAHRSLAISTSKSRQRTVAVSVWSFSTWTRR